MANQDGTKTIRGHRQTADRGQAASEAGWKLDGNIRKKDGNLWDPVFQPVIASKQEAEFVQACWPRSA